MQFTIFMLGTFAGIGYIVMGLLLMMLIDVRTRRIEVFTRNNDYWIFILLAAWPVFLPLLFLPRYRARTGAIRL